jgi:hypothetical protein
LTASVILLPHHLIDTVETGKASYEKIKDKEIDTRYELNL